MNLIRFKVSDYYYFEGNTEKTPPRTYTLQNTKWTIRACIRFVALKTFCNRIDYEGDSLKWHHLTGLHNEKHWTCNWPALHQEAGSFGEGVADYELGDWSILHQETGSFGEAIADFEPAIGQPSIRRRLRINSALSLHVMSQPLGVVTQNIL